VRHFSINSREGGRGRDFFFFTGRRNGKKKRKREISRGQPSRLPGEKREEKREIKEKRKPGLLAT